MELASGFQKQLRSSWTTIRLRLSEMEVSRQVLL